MTKTVTGILIDPFTRTVEAVQVPDTTTEALLAYLYATLQCQMVSCSALPNGDTGYYDDEGLLMDWDQQAFFQFTPYPYPVPGRWLITRMTPGLERDVLHDCKTTVDALRASVKWIEPKDVVVPSPTFTEYDKDGKPGQTHVVDGGDGTWSYKNQPN